MAKNNSEYTLHEYDEKGELHSFAPGDDLPSWVKVDNPYVSGKPAEESPEDESDEDAPRRGRPRKAANS